ADADQRNLCPRQRRLTILLQQHAVDGLPRQRTRQEKGRGGEKRAQGRGNSHRWTAVLGGRLHDGTVVKRSSVPVRNSPHPAGSRLSPERRTRLAIAPRSDERGSVDCSP